MHARNPVSNLTETDGEDLNYWFEGAIIFTPDIESHYISTVQLVIGIFPSKMTWFIHF